MTEELYTLSNCEVMRLDVDDEHYYYGGPIDGSKDFYLSVTRTLDIGAPFPEGLRQYLRATSYEEQKERLEMTASRGSKLHDGLDRLMSREELVILPGATLRGISLALISRRVCLPTSHLSASTTRLSSIWASSRLRLPSNATRKPSGCMKS
jgi:hypothetical protein